MISIQSTFQTFPRKGTRLELMDDIFHQITFAIPDKPARLNLPLDSPDKQME